MRCGGKVALVTGGQQGIGRAIALALAREGADVGGGRGEDLSTRDTELVAPRTALEAIYAGHADGRAVWEERLRQDPRVRTFDAYLMVDWSGASVPVRGADSIWIAYARRHGGSLEIREPLNPPTRAVAVAHLADVIDTHIAAGERVLVGFDFAFGYPTGFARALRLRGTAPAWRRTWTALALGGVPLAALLSQELQLG